MGRCHRQAPAGCAQGIGERCHLHTPPTVTSASTMRASGRRAIPAPSSGRSHALARELSPSHAAQRSGLWPPLHKRRFAHVATSVNALMEPPRMRAAIGAANGISLLLTAPPPPARLSGAILDGIGWPRKAARSARHGHPRQGCTSARHCCHAPLGPAFTPPPRPPIDQLPTLPRAKISIYRTACARPRGTNI